MAARLRDARFRIANNALIPEADLFRAGNPL